MANSSGRTPTAYQNLQKAAKNYCVKPNDTNANRLQKAETKYRADAEKKGKSKGDISKIVSSVKKCSK